jgi:hypothetical protein
VFALLPTLSFPKVCCVLRFLVYLNPKSINMILIERCLSTAVVTGFFTSMRASLNDRLSGEELSVSGGEISTWAGAGVVLGPFIEAILLRNVGARYRYAAPKATLENKQKNIRRSRG